VRKAQAVAAMKALLRPTTGAAVNISKRTMMAASISVALTACGQMKTDDNVGLSANLPEQCSSSEIVRIPRPISSIDATLGSFSYAFRFKAPTAGGAPVLVYLPGGPGVTSIDQVPDFLPHGWGYLLTDPRGVGCNALAAIPAGEVADKFYRTEELSADVIAAVQDRRLSNYIVYGLSYGTMLGATVVSDLESRGITAPEAVILEGVVGRALTPSEYLGDEYVRQWNLARQSMYPDVLAELDTAASPYGLTQLEWSNALNNLLLSGPDIVSTVFETLSNQSVASLAKDEVLQQLSAYDKPFLTDPAALAMFHWMMCREAGVKAISMADPLFSHGQLVPNPGDPGSGCDGIPAAPYDSAQHQFSTKVYFFAGDSDPNTPPWQVDYHFQNHEGHAVRVVTERGGHLSLQLNQFLCASDVLTSIAAGGADLGDVLLECPLGVQVDQK
jgi:pimeloyl-ACP methyl ester carboxylesterase